METTKPSMELQRLRTPKKLQIEPKVSDQPSNVSSRCTRSQVDPDWSLQEMQTLVTEIIVIESEILKALPSYQKWKIITDNCNSFGVIRSLNQCRRKWELLVSEYNKIKEYESQSGTESYWILGSERKMELGLSVSFEKELFESIDEHFKALEDRRRTDTDSDSELDVIVDSDSGQRGCGTRRDRRDQRGKGTAKGRSGGGRGGQAPVQAFVAFSEGGMAEGSKKKRRGRDPPRVSKREEREEEMAMKLREQGELIHAIVRGDVNESVCHSFGELKNTAESQVEFKRWQANELIKALEGLCGTVDQVSNMVKGNM